MFSIKFLVARKCEQMFGSILLSQKSSEGANRVRHIRSYNSWQLLRIVAWSLSASGDDCISLIMTPNIASLHMTTLSPIATYSAMSTSSAGISWNFQPVGLENLAHLILEEVCHVRRQKSPKHRGWLFSPFAKSWKKRSTGIFENSTYTRDTFQPKGRKLGFPARIGW